MTAQEQLTNLQREIYLATRGRGEKGTPAVASLIPWLLDQRNLNAALQRVSEASGSRTPGIDGVIVADVLQRSTGWLTKLSADLYHQRYTPKQVRWVDIPGDGKIRRLGILTVSDRVVHTALKQVLEPILDPLFLNGSFGFRPGRSVSAALQAVTQTLEGPDGNSPYRTVIATDVAQCFDTIDLQMLTDRLEGIITDTDALSLIESALRCGRASGFRRTVGLIQGSSLSPLMCNFYLHSLDQAIDQLRRETAEQIQMFRYADDFVILATGSSIARSALRISRRTLKAQGQTLNRKKTKLATTQRGFNWLGVEIQAMTNGWDRRISFEYLVPSAKVLSMFARLDEMTEPPSERINPDAFDLGRWLKSINEQLDEWFHTYQFAANASHVFNAIDQYCSDRVGQLLQSVYRLRRRALEREHRVRLPRGFQSWQVQGARLIVLSARAPRRPVRLCRLPDWARRQTVPSIQDSLTTSGLFKINPDATD